MSPERERIEDDGVSRAWISVGVPILGLIFLVILLALALLSSNARDQDRAYVEASQRLIAGSAEGRTQTLAGMAVDYANWDQAYQAVTVAWDRDWLEGNFYSSIADGMLLFRSDGSVRYAWFSDAYTSQSAEVQSVAVIASRAIPGLRDLPRAANVEGTVSSTFTRLDGKLVIISVAAVTLEDEAARLATPANQRTDYFAIIDVIETERLAQVGASLGLQDISFVAGAVAESEDHVIYPIADATGRVIGALRWRHAHPGAATFMRQVWPTVIGLLCIGALAIFVARLLVTRQVRAIASARAAMDSSQEKSEFLARVSHELRTPLNAVIGYAEMIQEDASSLESRTDAGRIVSAARHLSHLINDIIDQSRLDSGRMKLNREVLPVAGMLAEAQGLLATSARTAKVQLNMTSSPLADFVLADHVRLRQCLLNLIGNAIKFSPQGASVSVRARLEAASARKIIVFDVTDTGIGIASAEIDKIFRPFGQANEKIGKAFGGTGLGLSIARDLAREMGGDIAVISELGVGSTFSLMIPAATSNALRAA